MKIYFIVYQVQNKINGKVYIGAHKTTNLDDVYMGSGTYLNRAISKYGLENFTKEILFVFDTSSEMYEKEAELVDRKFLAEGNTYNIKLGGNGGWDFNNTEHGISLREWTWKTKVWSNAGTERFKELYYTDSTFNKKHNEHMRKIKKLADASRSEKYPEGTFKGKSHSESTKKKMSTSAKARLKNPENNSQYGTMWITDETRSVKIKKGESIPDGWIPGRVIKKKSEYQFSVDNKRK